MSQDNLRNIDELIFDLCDTILRKADDVDKDAIETYIQDLKSKEITLLNENSNANYKQTVRAKVQAKITQYINTYKQDTTGQAPFDFDSSTNYQEYITCFTKVYAENNNSAQPPAIFSYVFECIKEASEHYRFFEVFYSVREEEVKNTIKQVIDTAAKDAALEASKEASAVTEILARNAANSAQEAVNNATITAENVAREKAEKTVDSVIEKKLDFVTKKLSETNVTILGIFASIVLTVVAGFFYSASVINNINTADFYKLLCITSLVGFVCLHLLVALFRFIAYLSGKSEQPVYGNGFVIFASIMLIICCIIGFLMFWFGKASVVDSTGTSSEINVNLSVTEIESVTETTVTNTTE